MMFSIDDYRWLGTPTGVAAWNAMQHSHASSEITKGENAASLGLTVSRWNLLCEQQAFAKQAINKFPDPSKYRWTRPLLEQSSDHWCALETALDFPADVSVVDVCCGAGADSIALSDGRSVTAIDLDPIAAQLTELNSLLHQRSITVRCEDASNLQIPADAYLHMDPDRRQGGGRVTSVGSFQPNWETIQRLRMTARGCSIKVAPATAFPESSARPETVRFLSRDRSVRQQRWLWGLSRWPVNSVVLSAQVRGEWHHEQYLHRDTNVDLWGGVTSELSSWIGDYDPVVRAAKLSLVFATQLNCQVLQLEGGYLVSDAAPSHPYVKWYRVLEVLPQDRKKLVAYARCHPCRLWTLKSRGVDVDLDMWRKVLPTVPESEDVRTILFTKIGLRHRAIVAIES